MGLEQELSTQNYLIVGIRSEVTKTKFRPENNESLYFLLQSAQYHFITVRFTKTLIVLLIKTNLKEF